MKIKISQLSLPFFLSLFGFYVGNLFPTLVSLFESIFVWKHSVAFFLICFHEFLGFLLFRFRINNVSFVDFLGRCYNQFLQFVLNCLFPLSRAVFLENIVYKLNKVISSLKVESTLHIQLFVFSIRSFQFGFLLGFFVDAFKVGS